MAAKITLPGHGRGGQWRNRTVRTRPGSLGEAVTPTVAPPQPATRSRDAQAGLVLVGTEATLVAATSGLTGAVQLRIRRRVLSLVCLSTVAATR